MPKDAVSSLANLSLERRNYLVISFQIIDGFAVEGGPHVFADKLDEVQRFLEPRC
jgi:hypothetical protein